MPEFERNFEYFKLGGAVSRISEVLEHIRTFKVYY